MTTTAVELPAIWDDARDIPFFRVTARLFSAEFCFGASSLLAGNDDDPTKSCRSAAPADHPRQHRLAPDQPRSPDDHHR